MSKNEQKKFLFAVSKGIVCSPKMKKQFLNDLSSSIEEFQRCSGDECSVTEHFGNAEQIALDFMETVDPNEIQLYQKKSAIKSRIIIGGCFLVIVALISIAMDFYFNRGDPSKTEITTVIYAEDPAPDSLREELNRKDAQTYGDSSNAIQ